jgi:hypothetical protein
MTSMPFCFMNLREGAESRPEFPEGVDYLLLADLPKIDWGVYEFSVKSGEGWTPAAPVSNKLAVLIESGKRYPPALALAREELVELFGEHRPSQSEFTTAYTAALRTHLSRQPEAPFLLAPALGDEGGYLSAGEWYWILRVTGSPPIASWVSADFNVHNSAVADFDLTGQQLRQLGYS